MAAAKKPPREDSGPEPEHDVVLVHGRTPDGEGLRALRSRPERLEMAELRPLKQGQPLQPRGELIRLKPREESKLLFDVEVQYRANEEGHGGPPRVASREYRENWEAIFGKDPKSMVN